MAHEHQSVLERILPRYLGVSSVDLLKIFCKELENVEWEGQPPPQTDANITQSVSAYFASNACYDHGNELCLSTTTTAATTPSATTSTIFSLSSTCANQILLFLLRTEPQYASPLSFTTVEVMFDFEIRFKRY
jgi:hypothetical protein